MKIHFLWVFECEKSISEVIFQIRPNWKIQDGHHPKNNCGIIWDWTTVESYENTFFCRFLSLKIPFLRLFFGFGYTGKDQDGLRPKYKYGIIRDLMVVESHENKLFVGLWVWKIHFRGYFSDSTILEKLKMDATQNTKVW